MEDVRRQFGLRVRFLRQAKGMSQEKLAGQAGVHSTYVSGVERGEYNVSLESIAKLANALGVQPAALLEGERARRSQNEADRLRAGIAKLLCDRDARTLRTVRNVVREMVKDSGLTA